jgi:hydroxymethylpyrimidine/phosphomethylpyrimidine kinase
MVTVMTIAGTDPTCGAGITADIKTFLALKVNPTGVVACVTAQNEKKFYSTAPVKADDITRQIESVLEYHKVSAVKIGMLYTKEAVKAVGEAVAHHHLKNIVLDPLIKSSSNASLIEYDELFLKNELFHHVDLITPNVKEAEKLSGESILKLPDLKEAALELAGFGCENVVITGFCEDGNSIDMLYDGEDFITLKKKLLGTPPLHGTGCTFSSAVAALLGLGKPLTTSVKEAKDYTYNAIKYAHKVEDDKLVLNQFFMH